MPANFAREVPYADAKWQERARSRLRARAPMQPRGRSSWPPSKYDRTNTGARTIKSDDWHCDVTHSAWGIVVIRFSSMSNKCGFEKTMACVGGQVGVAVVRAAVGVQALGDPGDDYVYAFSCHCLHACTAVFSVICPRRGPCV